ncbi:MAG: aminomethyl-transferring glycine dehydrogenase subunit GcvPA [Candidatus Aminicenantes bacterium]|nr:MAG: aminomethyl-transferring glycine dehydrogenase subunit GcvPA [Candidatus Aminicenantes bacterium]
MEKSEKKVHPYIPNSVSEVKAEMLKEIGAEEIEELYEDVPENLRFKEKMDLPEALSSEYDLKRHVRRILAKNQTCDENINFLGGGCWQHYIPAICDEINQRSEFLTAYAGEPYEDHGRFQALFEYQSLMGEILEMDVVNVPTYDWCQAASTSIRMAERITGRGEILVSSTISPERLLAIQNYCRPALTIQMIKYNPETGLIDLEDLKLKITSSTASIYFENPSYLGFIEHQGQKISDIAHEAGALSIVGVDPISLGVIIPPSNYGADIVCGDIQPFGVHMSYGGDHGGFIATRDEEKFVMEFPSRLFGITKTSVEGEYGFGDVAYDRTSFGVREKGKEFVGTAAALWGITAGVYLSLMGPKGMQEIGKLIMQKSQYAMHKLSEINGIKAPRFTSPHFKEFVVDFSDTGMTIENINTSLRKHGIFGGKDLSQEFPELGNCALFCVTEVHTKADIDHLIQALNDCLEGM